MNASTELIQKMLPEDLWTLAWSFMIPEKFLETMPDLMVLILRSKSMDSHEDKQSWFSLLPMMNDEQIEKLRDILTREKQKLEEIEAKYEQKKDAVVTRVVSKRENSGYQQKIATIKNNEAQLKEQEHAEADNLLNQI